MLKSKWAGERWGQGTARTAAGLAILPAAIGLGPGWLGRFASRFGLSPRPLLGAGVGALVVTVAAVSTQALRAARVGPAQVLRSE